MSKRAYLRQGGTFVPNHLIDDVMPKLKDTEWRVLLVIVRQTLGWKAGDGGRKESDWLAQSQLMRRTGRASEAVSGAVDDLVRKNLIDIKGSSGEALLTPQARRGYGGRLYFRLTPRALDAIGDLRGRKHELGGKKEKGSDSEIEYRKPNTTKANRYSKDLIDGRVSRNRRGSGWTRVGGISRNML